ncbi:MAG: septum formation protein Maf [Phycisphaerae bacterium]|nr:septum formation protein Maf [Phycisphaerae bacterium]
MDRASKSPPLILASASPRRRKLLAEAGLVFEVVSPPVDEPDHVGLLPPAQRAEALAYFKARSVSQYYPGSLILGADTIVAVSGVVLGKPADQLEARRMLQTLSGTRHVVITGVALLGPDKRRLIASETTYVTMRPMSNGEIESYIASGEWEGKAGAYAIQETADRFVVSVEGSFSNVVGLPVKLVKRMVNELWKSPDAHKPR